jgi:hypothetical protein
VARVGGEVQCSDDERGVPALPLVAGDVLHRGASRLAGEPGETHLVHAMPVSRIEADGADVAQSLDQAEHGRRLGGRRHLAQPHQPALAGVPASPCQRVQPPPLIGRQPLRQSAVNFAPSPVADLHAEPFERPRRWDDEQSPPALLHHQSGQVGQPVVLDRVRQQPNCQVAGHARAEGTELEPVLQLGGMTPPILL